MKRLILTTSDSSSGGLKNAKIADRVVGIARRLVRVRPPTMSETEDFFGPCHDAGADDLHHWQNWTGLIDTCKDYEIVELWAEPDPNGQLVLLLLLDFLRPHAEVLSKLILFHADIRIGAGAARRLGPGSGLPIRSISITWKQPNSHGARFDSQLRKRGSIY